MRRIDRKGGHGPRERGRAAPYGRIEAKPPRPIYGPPKPPDDPLARDWLDPRLSQPHGKILGAETDVMPEAVMRDPPRSCLRQKPGVGYSEESARSLRVKQRRERAEWPYLAGYSGRPGTVRAVPSGDRDRAHRPIPIPISGCGASRSAAGGRCAGLRTSRCRDRSRVRMWVKTPRSVRSR